MLMMIANSTAITVASPTTPGPTKAKPISHRAQRADRPEDPVLAIAGHDTVGQPGADESADAGSGEGEAVLPGEESELAEQEHGQQRLGGHDQSGDEHVVEVERPQAGMGQDMPPAVEQLTGTDPAPVSYTHLTLPTIYSV